MTRRDRHDTAYYGIRLLYLSCFFLARFRDRAIRALILANNSGATIANKPTCFFI